jgi:hypothetical protein
MLPMACMEDLAQIKQLYHFTDARNLPVIKEHGGILSSKLLREMGIEFHSGGNQWSIDQDLRTGMDAYVHLCWDYGHPMAHNIRQREGKPKVVYLKIDRSILERAGVMFSRDVANSTNARPLVTVRDAFEGGMIDYDAINNKIGSRRIQENYDRRVAAELSEILIPDIVEIDLIVDFPNG